MVEELISVIVPAYNVENYIDRCLKSLMDQTYKNLEIIVVDDGSTDHTFTKAEAFAKTDSRVKLMRKVNGGLSSARNYGLDHSTGSYVAFVDSDDYVEKRYVEKLYQAVKENKADAAICSFRIVDDIGKTLGEEHVPLENKTGRDILENVLKPSGYNLVVIWNKLYKKELFQQLRFDEGKTYEDEYIHYKLFWNCKNISVVDECLYNYVKRQGSITGTGMTMDRLSMLEEFQKLRMDFYQNKKERYLYELAVQRYCNWVIDCVGKKYACCTKAYLQYLQKEIRVYGGQALRFKNVPSKVKVQDILGIINVPMASVVKNMYKGR